MDPTNFPPRDKVYLHLSMDKRKGIVEKMALFKRIVVNSSVIND